MKNKIFSIILVLVFLSASTIIEAQGKGDPRLRRLGKHTGNRAGITFYNDGQIAGFNIGVDIRGEWPLGSGENYIGDLIPLIGVEFTTTTGLTLQSVTISRGPRKMQGEEKDPVTGEFRGWNPIPGFLDPNQESVAMSHLPNSWPKNGWADPGGFPEVKRYVDAKGNTEWWGYFGRGIINADQESYFVADDQTDNEFNFAFKPDSRDPLRMGMGLQLRQRGFQWSSFLAEDAIFWLYDIKNEGTYTFKKANFGTVVGTLAGGDGDSGDDLGYFDAKDWITYSWDSDGIGNRGQKVGYVGYAFLESPGNAFDGIDNDGDSRDASPQFTETDFNEVVYNAGDKIVLIDPVTYERTYYTVKPGVDTVYSMGVKFVINAGVTKFREGHIAKITNGVSIPDASAYDGIDNDLDGIIDENRAIHYDSRVINSQPSLKYKNYITGAGLSDLLIDEKRDNVIDEDGDWTAAYDDVGTDGLGPNDTGYPGPDPDGTEGNGVPDQGEPNFGRTDPDESDQIGLTAFNFFENSASPDMTNDSLLWSRMTPGRFDVIPPRPMDGDFIYASGFFPLVPDKVERFSVSLLFGENYADIFSNKAIVQQIYNAGYKFPQPPVKPKVTATQQDGKVVLYWDGEATENSRDFITKTKDFEGYKIYRATDAGFSDSRSITNALGVLAFDKPIAQFDLTNNIGGFFYPSPGLLAQVGGTTFYLGDNTKESAVVNKFVDSNVVKGQTYYYAVCAYDRGDEALDIFPSENSKYIFRENTGEIVTDLNTVVITPGARPIGYTPAKEVDVVKAPTFRATGRINFEIVDDAAIRDGFKYRVAFQDSALQGFTKSYTLYDLQTPDTVYIPSTKTTYIVNPMDSIAVPAGNDTIFVNGYKIAFSGTHYKAQYHKLLDQQKQLTGSVPIHHGFRLQLENDPTIVLKSDVSGFYNIADTSKQLISYTFQKFVAASTGPGTALNGIDMPYDYEIEFDDNIVGKSVADTLYPPTPSNIFPARDINFKVKNLTTGEYITPVFFKTGTLSTVYTIYFKEKIEGVTKRTWRVNITYKTANKPLEQRGSLKLFTTKPFSRYDSFEFTMKKSEIDNKVAASSLNNIKVVPNPYVVTHEAEARLLSSQTSGRGEREIRFTRVPPGAKISIFTVRGELIRTLYQNDIFNGDVFWNLRTEENIEVAYGVYVYVVDVPGVGTKIDKFALIK